MEENTKDKKLKGWAKGGYHHSKDTKERISHRKTFQNRSYWKKYFYGRT